MNKAQLFNKIIKEFKSTDIKFCVLRSYEELPDKIYNDVDILITQKDAPKFKKMVESVSKKNGWMPWLKPARYNDYHYVIQKYNKKEDVMESFSLDANVNLVEKGVTYSSGEKALREVAPCKNFFILTPKYELIHLLVHAAFGSPNSRDAYYKRIAELIKKNTLYKEATCKWVWPISNFISRFLRHNEVEKAISIARKGYLFFLIKNRAVTFRSWEWFKRQASRIARRLFPPGTFVVIAGPDGVGKSTTAKLLTQLIKQRYINTTHLHFGFRPAILPARKSVKRNLDKKDKKTSKIKELARFIYHTLDYILGYWRKIRPIKARNGIIIVERYFYDYLVRLDRKKININRWIVRIMFKIFIPKPDVFILLKGDYETIRKRRGDLSKKEINKQIKALNYWGKKTSCFFSVKTDVSPGEVTFKIAKGLFTYLR